jgi:hypothetical protein
MKPPNMIPDIGPILSRLERSKVKLTRKRKDQGRERENSTQPGSETPPKPHRHERTETMVKQPFARRVTAHHDDRRTRQQRRRKTTRKKNQQKSKCRTKQSRGTKSRHQEQRRHLGCKQRLELGKAERSPPYSRRPTLCQSDPACQPVEQLHHTPLTAAKLIERPERTTQKKKRNQRNEKNRRNDQQQRTLTWRTTSTQAATTHRGRSQQLQETTDTTITDKTASNTEKQDMVPEQRKMQRPRNYHLESGPATQEPSLEKPHHKMPHR